MSGKFKIVGPDKEEIGLHIIEDKKYLMIGGLKKYKAFIDHVCFNVLGLDKSDIIKNGERQAHKYRYYFKFENTINETNLYVFLEEHKLKTLTTMLRVFGEKWLNVNKKYKVTEVESIIKLT